MIGASNSINRRHIRRTLPTIGLTIGLLALAGCGGAMNLWQDVNPLAPKEPERRAAGPGDLISAEGRCGEAGETALTGAGVGLGMTECEVARRAGTPDRVDISTNSSGERAAVLTYLSGPRPGIYHFAAGRLTAMERAPEAAAPSAPKQAGKKPARR
jgi:hypothetical protein